MKKVIVLCASPEEISNSTTMAEAFIEGLNKTENVEAEQIFVRNIPMMLHSHKVKVANPEEEPELCAVCDKLQAAHGLVIATPTYNFSVPAGLKNFIDRIGYIALDYKNLNKMGQPTGQFGHLPTFFLVSGGTPAFHRRLMWFAFPPMWLWMVAWYYGAPRWGSIYGGGLTFRTPAKDDPKLLKKCRRAGWKYGQKLVK